MRNTRFHRVPAEHRRGTVMLVVLVIIGMLSFAAYSFTERMLMEYEVLKLRIDSGQQRIDAVSGVELLAARLDSAPVLDAWVSSQQPSTWHWTRPATDAVNSGVICILPTMEVPVDQELRLGPIDECAKLNLNHLPLDDRRRGQSVERLMRIPRMSRPIAEAILDWIDADDEPTEFGAESSFYTARHSIATPRQGPIPCLSELLLIRGITRELLYGEDTNANGILDREENDGQGRPPNDNQDGKLDRGWSEYLTVVSRESRENANGEPPIDVNQDDLPGLFDELEHRLGPEQARFVVAWRLAGSTTGVESQRVVSQRDSSKSARQRITKQLAVSEGLTSLADLRKRAGASSVKRGGLDLTLGAAYQLNSVIDLFGCQVRITIDGQDQVLDNPWGESASELDQFLRGEARSMTVDSTRQSFGRINIHQASQKVLGTIPGIDGPLMTTLWNAQRQTQSSPQLAATRDNLSWLVREKLITLQQLRQLAPYVCTGGTVFSGFSVGLDETSPRVTVRRFLIDASGSRPMMMHNAEHTSVRITAQSRQQLWKGFTTR